MWYLAILLGGIYGLYHSYASFYTPFKESKYYLAIVPVIAGCSGFLWALIVKYSNSSEDVYRAGSAHDGAIVLMWYIGSLFLFNLKMTTTEYIGIGFILIGVMLLKLGTTS